MSILEPYMPHKDEERQTWINNFSNKIGGYQATFAHLSLRLFS
ncbi:MAG: hypothetical protein ACYDCN_14485 [Bacteroidia bacterium]